MIPAYQLQSRLPFWRSVYGKIILSILLISLLGMGMMLVAFIIYQQQMVNALYAGLSKDETVPSTTILKLLEEQQSKTQAVLAVVFILLAVLAALSSIIIAHRIADPLKQITAAIRRLAVGDVHQPLEMRTNSDEFRDLKISAQDIRAYFQDIVAAEQRLAQGDLTAPFKTRSEQDAVGVVFNQMQDTLRQKISQFIQGAERLKLTSHTLAVSAGQTNIVTSQINETVQQVALGIQSQTSASNKTALSVDQMTRTLSGVNKGAQEQAAAVLKASDIATKLKITLQKVQTNATGVQGDAAKAAEMARKGTEMVEETATGMALIKSKMALSSQKVLEMGSRSEQIGDILEKIETISSQTNLLALNAAIEAARAGQSGKSFAVVAYEVRKLADRVSHEVKEIDTLIHNIQTTVSEAVKAMDESSREVENGVSRANQSGAALSQILESVSGVHKRAGGTVGAATSMLAEAGNLADAMMTVSAVVEENTAATEEMSAGSNEVTREIENIASVNEQNSTAVEEVSASTAEMSRQMQDVASAARNLSEMAQALKNIMNHFQLEKR